MKLQRFIETYEFAKKAHEGQKRKTGEPYISHPISATDIALEYGRNDDGYKVDEPTIDAILLHDVPEDTDVSLEEIKSKFGNLTALLVDGVTKVDGDREATVEKVRQYAGKDRRVILVKLSDRLDNLRRPVDPNEKDKILIDMEKYNVSTAVYVKIGRQYGYSALANEVEATLKKLNKILVVK